MSQYLQFFGLGLGAGAVFAALALGMVLTYKGTGVINFAAAAMATLPLYVFDDLRSQGKFTLPIPWLPSFEWGTPPLWAAVLIALVVAALLGAAVEVCVSRPLRNAPALAKVVAAVGVMLVLQAAIALKYGTEARQRDKLLSTSDQKIFGAVLPVDRLWLIALVIVFGGGLALWLSRSRTGLAVQAAAENERAASFAGLSPQKLGMVTWVLSTVFVSFFMIVAGQVTGTMLPTSLHRFLVPALAAALIARLSSLWAALIGGLALGALQSELLFLSQTKTWWPEWAKQGLDEAIPFVVIVVTLFLLGRSIPMRGDSTLSGLPQVILPRNRPKVIAILVAGALILLMVTSGSYRYAVITSLALALVFLSIVIVTGMVGQVSLAQAAFAGVAVLCLSKFGTAIPFPFSMLLSALLAMVAGLIVALPALRIRGAQLAVVTLAAALTLEKFVFGNPKILSPTSDRIPPPKIFGIDLATQRGNDVARFAFGLMVLVVVTITFILACNVMRSGSGRKMLAVRSNERAAAAIGISVAGVKLSAFAVASFVAGIGGALIGYSRGQLSVDSFGNIVGLVLITTAYLGGITSASGAFVAGAAGYLGFFYTILDRQISFGKYYTLLSGAGLLLTVLMNPEGIAGKTRADFDKMRAKRRAKKEAARPVVQEPVPEAAPVACVAPRAIGEVVLETRDITVRYGGLYAVNRVSIQVRAGEIVGLIGPNGAGKTSFVDAITGFTRCAGDVVLDGRTMTGMPAFRRAREGLVRTWQSIELFNDLTVENNARVADDVGNDTLKLLRDTVRPNPAPSQAVRDSIAIMQLDDVASRRPTELPLGRQKALGVARALALNPRVLLLDEPAAGMDTSESLEFGDRLREVAASGVGCLLIDHDMHLVLGVCDRIYVIEFGRQIAEGTPDEVRRNPAVREAYLGSGHVDLDCELASEPEPVGQS